MHFNWTAKHPTRAFCQGLLKHHHAKKRSSIQVTAFFCACAKQATCLSSEQIDELVLETFVGLEAWTDVVHEPLISYFWEKSIPVKIGIYTREVYFFNLWQRLSVNFAAPNDKSFLIGHAVAHGGLETWHHYTTRHLVIGLARNDYEVTTRQRPADTFVGFAAHDAGFAHSKCFKAFEIVGNAPQQFVVFADGVVLGGGYDDREQVLILND
jgi:hypothetical protein